MSVAFQLCGTEIWVQPSSPSWAYQRSESPTKVSSWRKYQAPPSSSRPAWPSRISGLPPGGSTLSSGVGGGGTGAGGAGCVLGGPPAPPCAWTTAGAAASRARQMTRTGSKGRVRGKRPGG